MKLQIKPEIHNLSNQFMCGLISHDTFLKKIHAVRDDLKNNRECAFCSCPNFRFRDELSSREYQISALCMDCQDEMFEKGGN